MSISAQCPNCDKKLKAKDELAGKRIKCPGCGQVLSVPAAPTPSEPKAAEPAPAPQAQASIGDHAGNHGKDASVAGSIPLGGTQSDSLVKVFVVSFASVAAVFVVTFLAGLLLAFLMPLIKSLQGESNKSIFQIALFAILGILFIGSFLVFNLVPLLVTTAACTNAKYELNSSSPAKRVAVVLVLALSSTALLWVCLPWLQYSPSRTAKWSESTLTIYQLIYGGFNLAVGVILASRARSARIQPVENIEIGCPKCGARLRTAKAKQCFTCGANWRDQPA